MKFKKAIAIFLAGAIALCALPLSSCAKQDEVSEAEEISNDIDSKFSAYLTDFNDSYPYKNNAALKKCLINWASSKRVSYTTDGNNVIMTRSASKGYSKASKTVIICPYDSTQLKYFTNAITMSLYLIKSDEKTGPLTVIFTPETGHNFSGIKTVSKKYIPDGCKVIALNGAASGNFTVNTGGSQVFRFTSSASYKKPKYTKTYKIKISGMTGGQLTDEMTRSNNPVLRLHSLLETLQKKRIGFEVASFTGGTSGNLCPTGAELVITVDVNDEETFTEEMDQIIEDFDDDMKYDSPDAEYTYTKVKKPSKVLVKKDSDKLISFLYTVLEGKYHSQNEDEQDSDDDDSSSVEPNACVNLSSISTGKKIVVNTVAYSSTEELLTEINKDESTLAYLSGIKFKKVTSVPVWNGTTSESFTEAISDAYSDYTDKSMQYADSITPTNANYVAKINKNVDIISLTVSDNIVKDCTGTVLMYMKSLSDSDSES